MGEAALWGAVGASALVVGAEVAFAVRLSRMVIGLIMAFGVGALISSVSFELVAPALDAAATWKVALGLAAGSLTFFLGDRAIASMGGSKRKDPDGGRPSKLDAEFHSASDPGHRYLLQAVGVRADVADYGEWNEMEPETCLVVIADAQTTDHDDVVAQFDACRTSSVDTTP